MAPLAIVMLLGEKPPVSLGSAIRSTSTRMLPVQSLLLAAGYGPPLPSVFAGLQLPPKGLRGEGVADRLVGEGALIAVGGALVEPPPPHPASNGMTAKTQRARRESGTKIPIP